jgi:hypothetical protein
MRTAAWLLALVLTAGARSPGGHASSTTSDDAAGSFGGHSAASSATFRDTLGAQRLNAFSMPPNL